MLAALAPLMLMQFIGEMQKKKQQDQQFDADKADDMEIMDLAAHDSDLTRDNPDMDDMLPDVEMKKAPGTPKTFSAVNRLAAARERNAANVEDLVDVDDDNEEEAAPDGDEPVKKGEPALKVDTSKPMFKMPKMGSVLQPGDDRAIRGGMGASNVQEMMNAIQGVRNVATNADGLVSSLMKKNLAAIQAGEAAVAGAARGRSAKGGR